MVQDGSVETPLKKIIPHSSSGWMGYFFIVAYAKNCSIYLYSLNQYLNRPIRRRVHCLIVLNEEATAFLSYLPSLMTIYQQNLENRLHSITRRD